MNEIEITKNFRLKLNPPKNHRGLTLITGKNGSGKTTLLRILAEKYKLENESFKSFLDNFKDNEISCFIEDTTIPQSETLKSILNYMNSILDMNIEMEKKLFLNFNLDNLANRKFKKCSTGEKKKFLILLNLCQAKKTVFFLDEPTENIDSDSKSKILSLIESSSKNNTLYITTHNQEQFNSINYHIHGVSTD